MLVGSQIRVICLPNIFYSFVLFPNIVLPFTPIPPVNIYIREREREGEGEEGGAEREVEEGTIGPTAASVGQARRDARAVAPRTGGGGGMAGEGTGAPSAEEGRREEGAGAADERRCCRGAAPVGGRLKPKVDEDLKWITRRQ